MSPRAISAQTTPEGFEVRVDGELVGIVATATEASALMLEASLEGKGLESEGEPPET